MTSGVVRMWKICLIGILTGVLLSCPELTISCLRNCRRTAPSRQLPAPGSAYSPSASSTSDPRGKSVAPSSFFYRGGSAWRRRNRTSGVILVALLSGQLQRAKPAPSRPAGDGIHARSRSAGVVERRGRQKIARRFRGACHARERARLRAAARTDCHLRQRRHVVVGEAGAFSAGVRVRSRQGARPAASRVEDPASRSLRS